MKKILICFYGFVLSSVIAGVAYLFIQIEGQLHHLLWENTWSTSWPYALTLIGLGTLLLIYLKKKWGNLPETTHDALHELKERSTVSYERSWKSLVMSLLILSLGAGVGPEAPLLGALIAYSIWQADKLRYLYFHWDDLDGKEKLAALLHPAKYLRRFDPDQKIMKSGSKKLLNSLYVANGLFVFMILMSQSDHASFLTKIGESNWGMHELLYLVPLLLSGFLFAYLYQKGREVVGKLENVQSLSQPVKLTLSGGVIFLISQLAPGLLFSGQHSMHTLFDMGLEASAIVLSLLAIGKLLLLDINLWAGWTGGDIFPLTFASLLQGFAMAKLLETQGLDTPFVVLVVGLAMAMQLMENRVLALIFVSLFFPVNLWPVSLLIFTVYELIARFYKKNQQS